MSQKILGKFSNLKEHITPSLALGAGIGSIGGVFQDVLIPISDTEIAKHAWVFALIVGGIFLLADKANLTRNLCQKIFRKYWCTPITLLVVTCGITLSAIAFYSENFDKNDRGILADTFPEIADYQDKVIMALTVINSSLDEIELVTKDIAGTSEKILETSNLIQENTHQTTKELETISDLTEESVSSLDNLQDALIRADFDAVERLLESGLDITMIERSTNDFMSHAIILSVIKNNHASIDEVFDYLSAKNAIDINKLYDTNNFRPELQLVYTQYTQQLQRQMREEQNLQNANLEHKRELYNQKQKEYGAILRKLGKKSSTQARKEKEQLLKVAELEYQTERSKYNIENQKIRAEINNLVRDKEDEILKPFWQEKNETIRSFKIEFLNGTQRHKLPTEKQNAYDNELQQLNLKFEKKQIELRGEINKYKTMLTLERELPRPLRAAERIDFDETARRDELLQQYLREEGVIKPKPPKYTSIDHTKYSPKTPIKTQISLLKEAQISGNQKALQWLLSKGANKTLNGYILLGDGSELPL